MPEPLLANHLQLHRRQDPYSQDQGQAPQLPSVQQAKQGYDIYNTSTGNSPSSNFLRGLFSPAGSTGLGGSTSAAGAMGGPSSGIVPAFGLPAEGSSSLAGTVPGESSGGLFSGKGAGAGAGAGGATGLGSGATMTSMYGLPAAGGSSLAGTTGGGAGAGAAGAGIGAGLGAGGAALLAWTINKLITSGQENAADTKAETARIAAMSPEEHAAYDKQRQDALALQELKKQQDAEEMAQLLATDSEYGRRGD